jgi:flagellar biosynthetic protein FliQ
MTIESAVYLGQDALMTAMFIGGPLLMTALVVGSLVSVVQTVTQVQEMTLVFVPKILAVMLVLGVAGAWMLQILVAYSSQVFMSISEVGP